MSTRRLVIGSLITIAGILILLAGIASQNIYIGVAGFVVMGAGVYFATTKSKQADDGGVRSRPAKTPSGGRSSFMSGLEDRWDERRRDQG